MSGNTTNKVQLTFIYLLAVVFILLAGCQNPPRDPSAVVLQHAPRWFLNREVFFTPNKAVINEVDTKQSDNQILGFGLGENHAQAKANALADISQQLTVKVRSSTEKTITTVENESSISQLSYSSRHHTKIDSSIELSQVQELKKTINEFGVYIVFSYQPSSLTQKLLALVNNNNCQQINQADTHAYLSNTPALTALKSKLGCTPNIKLFFKDDNWFASYKNKSVFITKNEYMQFLVAYHSIVIKVKTSFAAVQNHDLYFISSQVNQSGYLSLILLSSQGSSQLLIANQFISKYEKITYPDKKKYQGLEAISHLNSGVTKDLVIGILCSKAINLTPISLINQTMTTTHNEQFFNYLFEKIQSCHLSSQFISIHSRILNTKNISA